MVIFITLGKQKPDNIFVIGFSMFLAGVERFELTTSGFGDRRSTSWSYTPANEMNYTSA
jgi:hypothetical protein